MSCAACAIRIEKGLNKLEGVNEATVNLALVRATVEYNPSLISAQEIIKRVETLGYGAISKEEKDEKVDHRLEQIKKQQGKFIFSAILSFPLLWAMVSHFSFTSSDEE
nr:cation transporter [Neobacillus ginsengisoli]